MNQCCKATIVITSPHTYQYTKFYDNIIRLIMCKLNNVVISRNEVI